MRILIFLILITLTSKGQECSPYHTIPKYEYSKEKSFGLGYVSCFHARGVVAEVGYENIFTGVLLMGESHHNDAYGFIQYDVQLGRFRLYAGPIYRLNNQPSILIGRGGFDLRLIDKFYFTLSLLQVSQDLNYMHFGLKINY